MLRVLTIIGAHPQFIKASVVSCIIQKTDDIEEIMLHTGQHFDASLSDICFNKLGIPRPDIQLDIHGGKHGEMTGRMLQEIEQAILEHKPYRVFVYGDTNSTLTGALAAARLRVPVTHVEAGLRSFNNQMPEEVNRILTVQISDLLLCPITNSFRNLEEEGFAQELVKLLQVGDVMRYAALLFAKKAVAPTEKDIPQEFVLAMLHRAENSDNAERLAHIVRSLNWIHQNLAPVLLPLHPRARKLIAQHGLELNVKLFDPVGDFEMIWLLDRCQLVLTDSGGVQKEAFFSSKACVAMHDKTELVELLEAGANEFVGADEKKIIDAVKRNLGRTVVDTHYLYSVPASERIVEALLSEKPQ